MGTFYAPRRHIAANDPNDRIIELVCPYNAHKVYVRIYSEWVNISTFKPIRPQIIYLKKVKQMVFMCLKKWYKRFT